MLLHGGHLLLLLLGEMLVVVVLDGRVADHEGRLSRHLGLALEDLLLVLLQRGRLVLVGRGGGGSRCCRGEEFRARTVRSQALLRLMMVMLIVGRGGALPGAMMLLLAIIINATGEADIHLGACCGRRALFAENVTGLGWCVMVLLRTDEALSCSSPINKNRNKDNNVSRLSYDKFIDFQMCARAQQAQSRTKIKAILKCVLGVKQSSSSSEQTIDHV